MINTLGQSSPYPDLRDETETIYGTWYTYCDHNVLSYSGNSLVPNPDSSDKKLIQKEYCL